VKKINSVEEYIERHEKWTDALILLRSILNTTELKETLKWSAPVYTMDGKNVVGLGAFKNHFGLWFFNGVFLKDKKHLLVSAQETTKALRQMRFQSIEEIDKHTVLSYVKEAIENQKLGKELKPEKKPKNVLLPAELQKKLKTDKDLNKAFNELTPYKQREYAEYIGEAKREATKQSRLKKIVPMIRKGFGLNDKYKNC